MLSYFLFLCIAFPPKGLYTAEIPYTDDYDLETEVSFSSNKTYQLKFLLEGYQVLLFPYLFFKKGLQRVRRRLSNGGPPSLEGKDFSLWDLLSRHYLSQEMSRSTGRRTENVPGKYLPPLGWWPRRESMVLGSSDIFETVQVPLPVRGHQLSRTNNSESVPL